MSEQRLREVGLKITAPRLKVLALLEQEGVRHLSAETIHQELRDAGDSIGLATVYRVLNQFKQEGMVTQHDFDGGYAVFELSTAEHHDHLVCVSCDRVEEFCDDLIESQQKKIAKKKGFKLTDHRLTLYGICSKCQIEN